MRLMVRQVQIFGKGPKGKETKRSADKENADPG